MLGAGTFLDPETARIAILAGANFVVSPTFNLEIAKLCNRYAIPYIPGCATPTEVITAMESGVDIIKLFPSSLGGIKIINEPLPQAQLMPTVGVQADNVGDWIKAGAVCVGASSSLTEGSLTGDYDKIVKTAKKFIQNIQRAREEMKK